MNVPRTRAFLSREEADNVDDEAGREPTQRDMKYQERLFIKLFLENNLKMLKRTTNILPERGVDIFRNILYKVKHRFFECINVLQGKLRKKIMMMPLWYLALKICAICSN